MRRRQLFLNLLAVVSTAFCVHAQNINNFNSNWVFGDSIHLRFSPTPSPSAPILNSAVTHNMRNEEGNASISDGFGNLLFYAGHPTSNPAYFNLYDANYNLMPNGQNLISEQSASQGIIITRDPDDCSEYYVFYVSNTVGNGLRYSKVDMDLNGGMGDVIPGEKDILLYSTRGEKVIIAQKEDSKYFWVITRRIDPSAGPLDELVSIGLQPGGVFAAPVISVFSVPPATPGTGYMNMRSDHLKLADIQYATKQVNTYDFNPATGVFSNRTTIYNSPDNMPYGGCFSIGGNVLYVTFQQTIPGPGFGDEILRRYDLLNSPTGAIFTDLSVGLSDGFHAIQRSTKGKLYMTQGSTQFMHVVNDPDNYSTPNIVLNGLTTTRMLLGGVPNQYFPWEAHGNQEFMNINGTQEVCFNTSAILGGPADSIEAVYSWQGQISTPSGWSIPSSNYLVNPNAANPTTINLTSGTYRFILSILTPCGDTIFDAKEFVMLDSLSTPVISGDLDYCFGETITPLTSTPALLGVINWYADAGLTSLLATGTSFTPSNTVGSTTYYVVEQLSGGLVPGPCTGFVTAVTVNIDPQAPLCYTKRAAKWYMGNTVALNFLCASPPTPLDDCTSSYSGNMENNVSISDDNGNLLFYAYDNVVKNRNHVVMPNGSGLNTDYSASQGFLPVPHPTNPNRYYLFTIGSNGGTGFYYSEIDLLANGGLGDVVPATKNTMLLAGVPEHLTAVESCIAGETWVIVHDANNIYSFRLSAAGISAPVVSPSPVSLPSSPGQIKASPTGRHIALSVQNSSSFLFTFDNETGEVCYKETLTHGGYGCSFSNNGQYFYANEMFQGIYQYNVYAANVDPTGVLVYDPWSGGTFLYGGMHLGPDCKLYVFGQGQPLGTVINNPNAAGAACNIQVASFPLSNGTPVYSGHFSSANYVQSWFKDPTYVEPVIDANFTFVAACIPTPINFTNTSVQISDCPTYSWNFGDPSSGVNNVSSLENPSHVYSEPGTYNVSLTITERCQTSTEIIPVTIGGTTPIIYTPDSWYCVGDDNIAALNTSNGTHWYTDPGLTTQVGTGASFTPPATVGVVTYYVVNNTAGCISASASVDVEFSNCPASVCSSNLITNGDFETYTSCPTSVSQISLASGWLGSGPSYYNTVCFGFYNSSSYYPYFVATNYNLGLNGGGTFPPPSGDGYASLILGGT
ncbi:MAG: PKD domain-containing protein, partial [Bacteroidetes bacterium]|nr:PKD domain-containing protein [Bacteroidota bacterium]